MKKIAATATIALALLLAGPADARPVSLARARLAVTHFADRDLRRGWATSYTVGRCWRPSRSYVHCDLRETTIHFDGLPLDTAWVAYARASGNQVRVGLVDWETPPFSERR